MSFRPTIAVYFRSRPIALGYYRNWYAEDLLFEAVALALLFESCASREELDRAVRASWLNSALPLDYPEHDEIIRSIEECSELPVVVDLSARMIYVSAGPLTEEELKKRIPARDLLGDEELRSKFARLSGRRIARGLSGTSFTSLLTYCTFDFSLFDRDIILSLFRENSALSGRLSLGVGRAIHEA